MALSEYHRQRSASEPIYAALRRSFLPDRWLPVFSFSARQNGPCGLWSGNRQPSEETDKLLNIGLLANSHPIAVHLSAIATDNLSLEYSPVGPDYSS